MDRGLSIPFRVYEDFQPLSSFIHEDNSDTLTLTLPGYRKEQIKVQIDSFGTLKITGERPIGVGNKWSRFRKDFRAPANCKTGEIRAKFENEVLNIIMPKTTTQPPKPVVNVTAPSRPSDQAVHPTSTNTIPKTTTTAPNHDHKPTSTESPKLPPPPPPMVAPPSQKPATHEARVSPNKTVVPPSRKPTNEANFSPMKAVAPPNQKPVAEPILQTPKPQPPQTSAGTANAEALLTRKNPPHDYEDRKTTKTDHHQHHHHNPEEKKKWTSSSGSSSSSSNSSTEDDSDDVHDHEHDHVEKGRKENEIENHVHGVGSAAAGKLKKKKDELIQKMSDYRRQSGASGGGGMNMTSVMENYKNKFEGFMTEMKKKRKNSSTNDGDINTSDLVVNMAVASLVAVALGVYVTWSFKSILFGIN